MPNWVKEATSFYEIVKIILLIIYFLNIFRSTLHHLPHITCEIYTIYIFYNKHMYGDWPNHSMSFWDLFGKLFIFCVMHI